MRPAKCAWLVSLAALSCLVTNGCAHAPGGFDHRLATLESVLAAPATTGPQMLQRGWAKLLTGAAFPTAIDDFKAAVATLPPQASAPRQLALLGTGLARLAQARFAQALEAFAQAVECDPTTPEALVAALQLSETAGQTQGGHARLSERLESLLAQRPGPGPEVRRALTWTLREAAQRTGDWRGAQRWVRALGVVPVWSVAAVLGRHPLVDFDKPFEPERKPLAQCSLPGWVTLRPMWPDRGQLELEPDPNRGVAYAESFFWLERADELSLRLTSQDNYAVFLDDAPVLRHAAFEAHLPGVERFDWIAEAGWHRLLVKVALRRQGAQLGIEMTRRDGTPAQLLWKTPPEPMPTYSPGSIRRLTDSRSTPRDRIDARGHAAPHDALSALLGALLDWDAGDLVRARHWLREAGQRAPASALPDYLTALVMLEDPDLPPELDQTRSRERLEAALSKRPDFDLAKFRLALLEAESGQESEALEALAQLDRSHPESFLWPYYTGRLQERMGWDQEARLSYRRALERLPDHIDLLRRLLSLALKQDDLASQVQLAERLEALGHWNEGQAELWIQRGDHQRAQDLLVQSVERDSGSLPIRLRLFDRLVERNQLSLAAEQLLACQSLAPGNLDVLDRQVDLFERTGKFDQAQALRAEIIRLHPWRLSTRKALAAARHQTGVTLAGEERFDGLEIITRAKDHPQAATGDALLLLDQATVEAGTDGSSLQRVHTIVQVLTPEGLEQWGEINLIPPGSDVEHLRTISADGQIHDAELIPGKDSITLPALQVGDYVEIEYLNGTYGTSLVQRGFLGNGFLFGLVGIPIRRSIYRLAVPAGTDLVIDRINQAPAAKRSSQVGLEVLEFQQRNTPALADEAHSPPLHEFAPQIRTGWGVTWQDLRDARRVELIEAARLTPGLRRYALSAAGTGSRDIRLRRLFDRVCADIRWAGEASDFEQPASYVLARREGNRLVLLYALLRALGVEPRLLLARTLAHAQVDYRLPAQESFSYGLLAVPGEDSGSAIWLDPTERYNPYGVLFPFLDGMPAMEVTGIDPDQVFTRLPKDLGADQEKRIDLDLKLHADGTLVGTGREAISTSQAVQYRQVLLSMSQAQQRQAMEAGLGGYFSGSLLENFELENLTDPSRPLVIQYRFRAPAWAARRADALVLQGGFYPYQLVQNLITGAERSIPLLITDLTRTHTSVRLELPPGSRAELPESVRWTGPLSEFEMRVVQDGAQLRIDKRLTVRPGRIAPGDYPAFREFSRKVDARDTARIVIGLVGLAGS